MQERLQTLFEPVQQRNRATYKVHSSIRLNPEQGKANVSFLDGLKECSSSRNLAKGKTIHAAALQSGDASNIYLASTLVNMYAKCGNMPEARKVFEEMRNPTVVSWNALLFGYAENGEGEIVLGLFSHLRCEGFLPDSLTYVAVIKACGALAGNVDSKFRGMAIHALAMRSSLHSNPLVTSSLIDMYAKCGVMDHALNVFKGICKCNVDHWNGLIFGYAENGEGSLALEVFSKMGREGCAPDERTFVGALKACTCLAIRKSHGKEKWKTLEKAAAIHSQAVEYACDTDVYVASTLIDLYAKCGSMENARAVFGKLRQPSVVPWTALILGYADNGEASVALEMFSRMKHEGCAPNSTTFVAVLKACGILGALETGKVLHREICDLGFDSETVVQNSLVDFYGKCGSMEDAQQVFDSLSTKDLVAWTSLISGYSRHGDTRKVFKLFETMWKDAGLKPDGLIFSCILNACSHAGLVDKGKDYFEIMSSKFGVCPEIEHYHCMVDLLGRCNELEAAVELVKNMPYSPDVVTWTTILGACQKWRNVEIGRDAFDSLLRLDQRHPVGYLLMANIYGSVGMWHERSEVLALKMKQSFG